ncbi:hypothetical protein PVK06_004846 [Gossypium arboreum]|uniref:Bet v I/Major latex protein domain-containing protein n=1 Tax=Gossypium arboreum TaxID=29729 RepID=A0ABR0QUC1_GOSAR|nr:hypothetical protein PVK06_004846 [Gossypium arboreum]
MSSLTGTLEADVKIDASAEIFYGVICSSRRQLLSICPNVILAYDLLDGVWGSLGSII